MGYRQFGICSTVHVIAAIFVCAISLSPPLSGDHLVDGLRLPAQCCTYPVFRPNVRLSLSQPSSLWTVRGLRDPPGKCRAAFDLLGWIGLQVRHVHPRGRSLRDFERQVHLMGLQNNQWVCAGCRELSAARNSTQVYGVATDRLVGNSSGSSQLAPRPRIRVESSRELLVDWFSRGSSLTCACRLEHATPGFEFLIKPSYHPLGHQGGLFGM